MSVKLAIKTRDDPLGWYWINKLFNTKEAAVDYARAVGAIAWKAVDAVTGRKKSQHSKEFLEKQARKFAQQAAEKEALLMLQQVVKDISGLNVPKPNTLKPKRSPEERKAHMQEYMRAYAKKRREQDPEGWRKYQREKAKIYFARLKEADPEAYQQILDRRRAKNRRLRIENPAKYEELKAKAKAKAKAKLAELKQTNPAKYQEKLAKQRQKRRELKTTNPEKYKEVMRQAAARLKRMKEEEPERYQRWLAKQREYNKRSKQRLKKNNPEKYAETLAKMREYHKNRGVGQLETRREQS